MALRAKRPCNAPLCRVLLSGDARYCEKHAGKEKKRQYEEKKQDSIWQLYQTTSWKAFRRWFIRMNPACQLIVNGEQCCQPAKVVHHRRGLRSYPEDLTSAEHCASLCAEHHHHGDGDRPGDEYTPTETNYSLEERNDVGRI
jgi:hypothetical protein